MNRRGFAIIGLLITLTTSAAGIYVTDLVLKDQLGIGVMDLVNFVLAMDQTMEDAPMLGAGLGLPQELYDSLEAEKGNLTMLFSRGVDNLTVINSNPDVTSVLRAALGEQYSIYLFTVYNNSFKVFDWTITVNNGSIVGFEPGMIGEANVKVQLAHEIFSDLMKGQVSPDTIKTLVKEKQLKVNPILEVTRVYKAMPEIIRIVQEQTQA